MRQEIEQTSKARTQNLQKIEEERSKLQEVKKIHSEDSQEYRTQESVINSLIRKESEYVQQLDRRNEKLEKVQQTVKQSRRDTEEYSVEMGKLGNTKIQQNLKKTSNLLGSWGDKTSGTSVVATAIGSGATKIFTEYESGLAR